MKLLIALFLVFAITQADLPEIRKSYVHAADSEILAKEFAGKLKSVTNDSNKTLSAYKGASLTLSAKFSGKIGEKTRFFREGAALIESAIAAEPENIEIRLIRLSVQENVPKIVNYRKNKTEDKAFIAAHFKEQKGALKEYVSNFVQRSKSFTDVEKKAYQ